MERVTFLPNAKLLQLAFKRRHNHFILISDIRHTHSDVIINYNLKVTLKDVLRSKIFPSCLRIVKFFTPRWSVFYGLVMDKARTHFHADNYSLIDYQLLNVRRKIISYIFWPTTNYQIKNHTRMLGGLRGIFLAMCQIKIVL